MTSPHLAGPAALLLLAVALAGCAPRSLPASFPASSAASPRAAEAQPPRIGVALAEDPPLPGEPTRGWVGLEPAPGGAGAGGDPHQHHHHHHGHAPAKAPEPAHAPAKAPEPAHAH
ncbi:hypothetical protein SOCE26_007800 [Sorangium cellulosum]|uniref:Secreted protein n=1 Tax=Sorangium cellulosum TaxID=56 RepID=A0A2L0EJC1_SORCE|nr:hypothetical protein [Sorangium cellulosum]AUX39389.1 hypothetical protein SOCE26_007800 [Sorangium cellulosum]